MQKKSSMPTITAIATAPGMGGVGIVRLSGKEASEIGQKICGLLPSPRVAEYRPFKNEHDEILDHGIALYFKAPNSYTGEDVFELQAHGGPVVLNLILKTTVALGAQLAKPGEFTERAYLNEKIDLTQAEAVADLIESTTEQAARAASRSLQGEFSKRINQLLNSLIHIRMYIEAALDFPEEEIDFLSDKQLHKDMEKLQLDITQVHQSVKQGSLLREGMTLVILGQPNAGKSSLLNAMSGTDSAIVTEIAGTTRDTLEHQIQLDGLPINIVDTAGLRETSDVVEAEGVKRAWRAVEKADRILLVVDAEKGVTKEDKKIIEELNQKLNKQCRYDVVLNKIDLLNLPPSIKNQEDTYTISLSAEKKLGLELLTQHLKESVGYQQNNEGLFTARQRHLKALNETDEHIHLAAQQLAHGAGELAAEELRISQEQLSTITGEFSNDDLLGQIFSSFCIGK